MKKNLKKRKKMTKEEIKKMSREEIITNVRNAFEVKELVCPHTLEKFGENSLQVFKTETLATLLIFRFVIFKKPILVNSYKNSLTQRGFRCNICQLVKDKTLANKSYITSHSYGNAFDFTIAGMTGEEMRSQIINNAKELIYPIRLEGGVSWLHFDNNNTPKGEMIYVFKG